MIELELLGVNGDSVVLTDAQGQRFTLVIDDALRSAVRRDRVSVPIPPPEAAANMSPKQMQVLMAPGLVPRKFLTLPVSPWHACKPMRPPSSLSVTGR